MTLVKTVTNDNGGTLTANDFPRFIDGNAVAWDTAVTLTAGPHTASETSQPGYAASAWGGDCAADGTVTLANGDAKRPAPSPTTTSHPTLTLVKTVVNDNGGTRVAKFPALIDGQGVAMEHRGHAHGRPAHRQRDTADRLRGLGLGRRLRGRRHVTAGLGENKTCSITNNDIAPKLTLVKTVVNDNGGTLAANDFPPLHRCNAVAWSTWRSRSTPCASTRPVENGADRLHGVSLGWGLRGQRHHHPCTWRREDLHDHQRRHRAETARQDRRQRQRWDEGRGGLQRTADGTATTTWRAHLDRLGRRPDRGHDRGAGPYGYTEWRCVLRHQRLETTARHRRRDHMHGHQQ